MCIQTDVMYMMQILFESKHNIKKHDQIVTRKSKKSDSHFAKLENKLFHS